MQGKQVPGQAGLPSIRSCLRAQHPRPPCASPTQDLADAEAALQLGFAGSLARHPTASVDFEAPAPAGQQPSTNPALAQFPAPGQQQAEPAAPLPSQPLQGEGAGEDSVAAELAAAQQQIDEELMNMVLRLDLDWGGGGSDDAEDSYTATLQAAQEGGGDGGLG